MNKVLRKLYKDDPEELQAAMRRHTSMFNTNCDWGSIIHGITISLEEQRALGHDDISPEVIQSLKLGLMGPLAGIGDSVDQGIVATIGPGSYSTRDILWVKIPYWKSCTPEQSKRLLTSQASLVCS